MNKKSIKDDEQYHVRLKSPVQRGHRKYLPRDSHVLKGSVIKELGSANGWEVFDDIQPAKA